MDELERLTRQKEQYGGQLLALDDLISRLTNAHIVATDPAMKVQLETMIEEKEAERQNIEDQLREVEARIQEIENKIKADEAEAKKRDVEEKNDQPHAREIIYDTCIVYSSVDQEFVDQLEKQLEEMGSGRRSRPLPGALLIKEPIYFETLDTEVCRCHTAIVVLSDAVLNRIEVQREQVELILNILKARTGRVIALCRSEKSLTEADYWDLKPIIDARHWNPESGSLPDDLISKIKGALDNIDTLDTSSKMIGLPFVIITMTTQEALQLSNTNWLANKLNPETFQKFQRLENQLKSFDIDPFRQNYGNNRDDWRPFGKNRAKIRDLIEDMIKYINQERHLLRRGTRKAQIKAQYYPFDPLIQGRVEVSKIYSKIIDFGCIVILDKLSIFHPQLISSTQQLIASSPRVALVAISPIGSDRLSTNLILESELSKRLWAVFNRFHTNYEPDSEFGVGTDRRLKRWLYSNLPHKLNSLLKPGGDSDTIDNFLAGDGGYTNTGWHKSKERLL